MLLLFALLWFAVAAQPTPTIVPIGAVQGAVLDSDDGTRHVSPMRDQMVTVRGVISELNLQRTSDGTLNNGLFLQNTQIDADGDPRTSDGIFVFLGRSARIGDYQPAVGDEVVLSGRVGEFFNLTQMTAPRVVQVVRSGFSLDSEVPAFDAAPPDDSADATRYWERHESMRARVPAGSLVTGARDVFGTTSDSEMWLIRGDSSVAQRAGAYERRVFRDPHPLDNRPDILFDDANGYRILIGNSGLQALQGIDTLLVPSRTFDLLGNDLVGAVFYTFGKYRVEVTQQPVPVARRDPSQQAPLSPIDRTQAYAVASFNMENLYDFRDDPNDGCDFVGNAGCPASIRLLITCRPARRTIRRAWRTSPSRLWATCSARTCCWSRKPKTRTSAPSPRGPWCAAARTTPTASPTCCRSWPWRFRRPAGRSTTWAWIAMAPTTEASSRASCGAPIGCNCSRRGRMTPCWAVRPGRLSRRGPAVRRRISNPKALNARLPPDVDRSTGTDGSNVFTRAAQVGLFRIWTERIDSGRAVDLYAIANHFSSGPDSRVGQRREQAAYNAAIASALLTARPGTRLVIGGDLNVYPRPDDPFAPGDPHFPSDQLGPLYLVGLFNLWDRLVAAAPADAYTYVFDGQAQTLDNLFVSPALLDDLRSVQVAHINADFPADDPDDGPRGTSDHDPPRAVFAFGWDAPNVGSK